MKTGLWLIAVGALLALVTWSLQDPPDGGAARARPAAPVTVYTVSPAEFRDEASALGTLRAWESIDVSASVSQIVTDIRFDDGQQVRQGDVLALLKQDAEQATLRELEVSLADAGREVRRLENLARQNQVAQTDLDTARTLEQVTRHRIEEIQARIADRTIVAPFSGVLGLREVSPGALVTAGQRLTTLDDLGRMRLDFTLPARQIGFLRVGQVVEARTPAFDRVFEGVISAVDSRVDPVARAASARAVLDNAEGLLRPGLLMELTVRGPERRALLIPEESLQSRSSRHFVWKMDGDNARRTEVALGGRRPGWVEIKAGLAEGDQIVRDGVGRLGGDAAAVSVVNQ